MGAKMEKANEKFEALLERIDGDEENVGIDGKV